MKVCFVLPDLGLSGGVGTVIRHASGLVRDHGMKVTIALTSSDYPKWQIPELQDLRIRPLSELGNEEFDVAVATWWRTCYSLFDVKASRYVYFVQSLEDRFYPDSPEERFGAAITHALPVAFITEAKWIAEFLGQLRPEAPCFYVRNGIDKATFKRDSPLTPRHEEPVRVLLEGHPDVWFKGLADSISAVQGAKTPLVTTWVSPSTSDDRPPGIDRIVGPLTSQEMARELANTDVVVKTSRVEGMFGPPLEGFHCGATCITTAVTGYDEYIRHGFNAHVVDWDDPIGAAHALDMLSTDRRYLHNLRSNAMTTARSWPSWKQSTEVFAAALRTVRDEEPPAVRPAMKQLLSDVSLGASELGRGHQGMLELHSLRGQCKSLEKELLTKGDELWETKLQLVAAQEAASRALVTNLPQRALTLRSRVGRTRLRRAKARAQEILRRLLRS